MTYLELVNRLRMECGVVGNDLSSLTSVTGESLRMKKWIHQADLEIQELYPNWNFLRSTVSFSTVANQANYTASGVGLSNFANWKMDSWRCYLAATGVGDEAFLCEIDYPAYRDYWQFSTRATSYSRPTVIAQGPDKSLWLGAVPDAVYTVRGEYLRLPIEISADSDSPPYPTRFHMLPVYLAMQSYASYESAPEVFTAGQQKYRAMRQRLEQDQLPCVHLGDALA